MAHTRKKPVPIPVVAAGSLLAAWAVNVAAGPLAAHKGGISGALSKGDIQETVIDGLLSGHLLYTAPMPLALALAAAALIWAAWAWSIMNAGNFRYGEEHGSARFATPKEMRAYGDWKDLYNNVILSQDVKVRFQNPTHEKIETNNNYCIIGGSGSGKTRYVVMPNMMQANANVLLTDPKGTTIYDAGNFYEAMGYEIRTFNTIDPSESHHFNPLDPRYITNHAEITQFVNTLIKNTTAEGKSGGDPFWEKAEALLYTALVAYLVDHVRPEDRNLAGLLQLLALANASEEDEGYMSPLDWIFNELETGMRLQRKPKPVADEPPDSFLNPANDVLRNPGEASSGTVEKEWVKVGEPHAPEDDFALNTYKQFKAAAGKTLKSIIISCNARLKPLDIAEVRELLREDDLHLDEMGDAGRKIAVFASMSDTDSTFDFLFALLMQCSVNTLCNVALKRYGATNGGALPRPVHFIFDEFANIGRIPDFERTIAVTRSRNIAITMIMQSESQAKENYGDNNTQTILNCCDSMAFLGGTDPGTLESISKMIGKETVTTLTHGETRGQGKSGSSNYGLVERDLMQPNEIRQLPKDEMIVLMAGGMPYVGKKFAQDTHPRYGLLKGLNDKYGAFDIKAYDKRREAGETRELTEEEQEEVIRDWKKSRKK